MAALKLLLGSLLIPGAHALNWALLATGSKLFENYRHQADLCHAYHLLLSKGFSKDRIIVMSYDDVPYDELNKFPGKLFNSPDADGPGVDVRNGCNIDYRGDDVTAANFIGLLLGNGVIGGNGRTLDIGPDDNLLIAYFDHGSEGLIQFPVRDALHVSEKSPAQGELYSREFLTVLKTMHAQRRYGKMVIYIEACQSGSMLEDLPTDINVYGVTAVGPDVASMAAYCRPMEAVINGVNVGACLGDVFAVHWMRFVAEGDGSQTLNSLFKQTNDEGRSYASLHNEAEINVQYGDLSMGDFQVKEFFHGDSQSGVALAAAHLPKFVPPLEVFAVPGLNMHRMAWGYSESAAQPLFQGYEGWIQMLKATSDLEEMLAQQKNTQKLYWCLVRDAYPLDEDQQGKTWTMRSKPDNLDCEIAVRNTLVEKCAPVVDLTTSYALQFHQVVVNLCNDKSLGWADRPDAGQGVAALACAALLTPGSTCGTDVVV